MSDPTRPDDTVEGPSSEQAQPTRLEPSPWRDPPAGVVWVKLSDGSWVPRQLDRPAPAPLSPAAETLPPADEGHPAPGGPAAGGATPPAAAGLPPSRPAGIETSPLLSGGHSRRHPRADPRRRFGVVRRRPAARRHARHSASAARMCRGPRRPAAHRPCPAPAVAASSSRAPSDGSGLDGSDASSSFADPQLSRPASTAPW